MLGTANTFTDDARRNVVTYILVGQFNSRIGELDAAIIGSIFGLFDMCSSHDSSGYDKYSNFISIHIDIEIHLPFAVVGVRYCTSESTRGGIGRGREASCWLSVSPSGCGDIVDGCCFGVITCRGAQSAQMIDEKDREGQM
jgi:hypothetical protein